MKTLELDMKRLIHTVETISMDWDAFLNIENGEIAFTSEQSIGRYLRNPEYVAIPSSLIWGHRKDRVMFRYVTVDPLIRRLLKKEDILPFFISWESAVRSNKEEWIRWEIYSNTQSLFRIRKWLRSIGVEPVDRSETTVHLKTDE